MCNFNPGSSREEQLIKSFNPEPAAWQAASDFPQASLCSLTNTHDSGEGWGWSLFSLYHGENKAALIKRIRGQKAPFPPIPGSSAVARAGSLKLWGRLHALCGSSHKHIHKDTLLGPLASYKPTHRALGNPRLWVERSFGGAGEGGQHQQHRMAIAMHGCFPSGPRHRAYSEEKCIPTAICYECCLASQHQPEAVLASVSL